MSTVYREETILAKTVETLSYKREAEFLLNDKYLDIKWVLHIHIKCIEVKTP